ncbi:MAG: TIGR00180 family glycosyltransferase [Prevotellaceae bacterium]|nr:TIGR00180 family glycosyltransferase [Prevotellaceae bacterium]
MPDLSRVTVIIPAHNRPERLRRLLDYYSGTALQLLVPDSSDYPFPDADAYPTVTYLHRPRLHFLLKIREVLPLIKTPYVLYCADDDFTVQPAIGQVIDFLDAHPDYSVAQGHYLTFTPGKGGGKWLLCPVTSVTLTSASPPTRRVKGCCRKRACMLPCSTG